LQLARLLFELNRFLSTSWANLQTDLITRRMVETAEA
jgi:hypothetical protein